MTTQSGLQCGNIDSQPQTLVLYYVQSGSESKHTFFMHQHELQVFGHIVFFMVVVVVGGGGGGPDQRLNALAGQF